MNHPTPRAPDGRLAPGWPVWSKRPVSPRRLLLAALAVAAAARLPALLLGMEHYGDGPVRVEIAELWARAPHLWRGFSEAYQFGPLHLTLLGGTLELWPDRLWAPRVLSLLCGLAAVWLLFRIADRLLGPQAAFVAALGLSLSPLHIQASTTAASEAPFLALLLGAVDLLLGGRPAASALLLAAAGTGSRPSTTSTRTTARSPRWRWAGSDSSAGARTASPTGRSRSCSSAARCSAFCRWPARRARCGGGRPGGSSPRSPGSRPPTSPSARSCWPISARSRASCSSPRRCRCPSPGPCWPDCHAVHGSPPPLSPGCSSWPRRRASCSPPTGATGAWPNGRGRCRPFPPCPRGSRRLRAGCAPTPAWTTRCSWTAPGTTSTSRSPSPPGSRTSASPGSAGPTSRSGSRGAGRRSRCSCTRASCAGRRVRRAPPRTRTRSPSATCASASQIDSSTQPSTAAAICPRRRAARAASHDVRALKSVAPPYRRRLAALAPEVLDLELPHVALVAGEVRAENVRVIVLRDEEQVVALRGVQGRPQRGRPRVRDRPGREALHVVRVVGMRERQVALVQVPVPFEPALEQDGVDDRRVRLQLHLAPQAVVEDAGDPRPLDRLACLLLHDRGQRHRLQLPQGDVGGPLRLGLVPLVAEAAHHRLHDPHAARAARHRVGVGEEEALQALRRDPQLLRHRGIVRQPEELVGGAHGGGSDERSNLVGAQPFRYGEAVRLHFPADQLADHVVREQRSVELVFAGPRNGMAAEIMEVDVEAPGVGDHPGAREELRKLAGAAPRRNHHGPRTLSVRRRGEPALVEQAPGGEPDRSDHDQREQPEHCTLHRREAYHPWSSRASARCSSSCRSSQSRYSSSRSRCASRYAATADVLRAGSANTPGSASCASASFFSPSRRSIRSSMRPISSSSGASARSRFSRWRARSRRASFPCPPARSGWADAAGACADSARRRCQSSRSPGCASRPRSFTSQTCVASPFTKERLCETNSSVPSYPVRASMSASAESRSRWLVGSSMSRKLEGTTSSLARATRARSPPESTAMRLPVSSPEKRKAPRTPRTQRCG